MSSPLARIALGAAAALLIGIVSGCGSSSSIDNDALLDSMGTQIEDALAENAEIEFGEEVVTVKAPFGEENSCDGDGDSRTCELNAGVGSSEGSAASEFAEGKGGALLEFQYRYEVEIDGDCYTATSNDFDTVRDPLVAEAEELPEQSHSNAEAPTLEDCL